MATAPYPLLETVLTYTRVRVNDAIVSTGGQTFKDNAAFTPYYVNLAWRMYQQYLISLGFVRFVVMNSIILQLPSVGNNDAAINATLSWSGYFDGVILRPAIALPSTLVKPLKLAERPGLTPPYLSNPAAFIDMDGPEQGIQRLPSIPKDPAGINRMWTWDNDQINLPGALATTDLRIDFQQYFPDFIVPTGGFPGTQVVPILNSEDAFSAFVAYVFCEPRGDMDAGSMLANARDAASIQAGVKPPSEAAAAAPAPSGGK